LTHILSIPLHQTKTKHDGVTNKRKYAHTIHKNLSKAPSSHSKANSTISTQKTKVELKHVKFQGRIQLLTMFIVDVQMHCANV
jgi:hypothetical protein